MFLLSEDFCSRDAQSFERVHEKLRNNGCHSPTKDSLIAVFRAIKSLAALARLNNNTYKNKPSVSTEMLIKQLNGPDAVLDITGNGYEFSGWYSEIFVFQISGLIEINSRTSFTISNQFIREFVVSPYETSEHTYDRLFEHFQNCDVMQKLRTAIISRAKRFDIVHLLLAGTYAERS